MHAVQWVEPADVIIHATCMMYTGTFILSSGKEALTVFEREGVTPDGTQSLVRCRPVTGRTHQIRVHLQWLGESTVEPLYSKPIRRLFFNVTMYSS